MISITLGAVASEAPKQLPGATSGKILIILSLCLVLIGLVITGIRAARFIRRERIKQNQMQAAWMTELHKMNKEPDTELELDIK